MRTPVASGSPASSAYTSSDRSAHSRARASGSILYGHQSAPATAEVVRSTGSRVHTLTRWPRSARTSAVVRPMTPPPTTMTSSFRPISTRGP